MRTALRVSAILAAGVILSIGLSACAATSPTSAGSSSSGAGGSSSAGSPSSGSPSAAASPATLVLGPTGLGVLKLGMTAGEAKATGLLDTPRRPDPSASCVAGRLKGDLATRGGYWLSDDRGLAAIIAYGDIATPQGIKRGSSYAELHRVYPSWVGSGDHNTGHGLVAVPGNDDAYYRIDVVEGKVDSVTLQLRHQNCYE